MTATAKNRASAITNVDAKAEVARGTVFSMGTAGAVASL